MHMPTRHVVTLELRDFADLEEALLKWAEALVQEPAGDHEHEVSVARRLEASRRLHSLLVSQRTHFEGIEKRERIKKRPA